MGLNSGFRGLSPYDTRSYEEYVTVQSISRLTWIFSLFSLISSILLLYSLAVFAVFSVSPLALVPTVIFLWVDAVIFAVVAAGSGTQTQAYGFSKHAFGVWALVTLFIPPFGSSMLMYIAGVERGEWERSSRYHLLAQSLPPSVTAPSREFTRQNYHKIFTYLLADVVAQSLILGTGGAFIATLALFRSFSPSLSSFASVILVGLTAYITLFVSFIVAAGTIALLWVLNIVLMVMTVETNRELGSAAISRGVTLTWAILSVFLVFIPSLILFILASRQRERFRVSVNSGDSPSLVGRRGC